MEQNIIVLYANPWSLTDERTGQQRDGVSIQYINGESLTAQENQDGSKGYGVIKESIRSEMIALLRAVPGVYKAKMGFQARGGKNVLAAQDLELISAFAENASV